MNLKNKWWSRSVTFAVAALTAASGVYWLFQWPGAAPTRTAPVLATNTVTNDPQAIAELLGSTAPTEAATSHASSRFVLTGVVAGTPTGGAAVIAIDGQPAKTYRVGSRLDENWILQSVATRRAVLAPSLSATASITLEMKPPQK